MHEGTGLANSGGDQDGRSPMDDNAQTRMRQLAASWFPGLDPDLLDELCADAWRDARREAPDRPESTATLAAAAVLRSGLRAAGVWEPVSAPSPAAGPQLDLAPAPAWAHDEPAWSDASIGFGASRRNRRRGPVAALAAAVAVLAVVGVVVTGAGGSDPTPVRQQAAAVLPAPAAEPAGPTAAERDAAAAEAKATAEREAAAAKAKATAKRRATATKTRRTAKRRAKERAKETARARRARARSRAKARARARRTRARRARARATASPRRTQRPAAPARAPSPPPVAAPPTPPRPAPAPAAPARPAAPSPSGGSNWGDEFAP